MIRYKFGNKSKKKLNRACNELRNVARLALEWGIIDFAVIESVRSKAEQNKLFEMEKSRVRWPDSKHNIQSTGDTAKALDIVPIINGKISWDSRHCLVLAGVILAAASCLNVRLRWGGNWDMDGEPVTDQDFQDLVHFEIYEN